MSARLEWLTATETTPDLLRRGDEASDHTQVTGPFAMVLGHPDGAIIQGSLPELRAMLVRAAELLDIAELLQLLEPTPPLLTPHDPRIEGENDHDLVPRHHQ